MKAAKGKTKGGRPMETFVAMEQYIFAAKKSVIIQLQVLTLNLKTGVYGIPFQRIWQSSKFFLILPVTHKQFRSDYQKRKEFPGTEILYRRMLTPTR